VVAREADLDPTGLESSSLATEPPLTLTPAVEDARPQVWRALWELLHDLSVAVLFCFFLITFVAQAFRVQGTSMLPLLHDSERIIVNKFVYRFHTIDRGDVVVFWFPRDPSVSFIKRVVGLPGDTVELRSGVLYVNGHRVD
jgi:signal peptidase I